MIDALGRVRQLCLALPETTERLSHGAPTFFVRDKKTLVTFVDNHHGDGRLAIWCHAPLGVQEMLVEQDPERFFVPPYIGHRGWVGVRLERDVDWDEVADLIEDAYRMVAPKRLVAQLTSQEIEAAEGRREDRH
ncbi:MAG: MmcQ/YjbR family DNA-binding protein [Chloroflexota bacterium]|nr:MmcQ/YjbR family DNA-binding protein [Chloroflexota bacterium]